jgi:hypothetical protein
MNITFKGKGNKEPVASNNGGKGRGFIPPISSLCGKARAFVLTMTEKILFTFAYI